MENETKEVKKEVKQFENANYKERFQFILQINDNIICQRYFKINGISNDALESEEFKYVMDEVVEMIQNDLTSKSRVYDWYTSNEPLKLTGFVSHIEDYNNEDVYKITRTTNGKDEDVVLSNGEILNKTYFKYDDDIEDVYSDSERPADGEFVFKFSFLVDEKPMYERIWDANQYHKYVRNGVDLSNSDLSYRDKDPLSLYFNVAIIRRMTCDKVDLVYHIIKKICNALSTNNEENATYDYTKKGKYGDKTYYYSTYNRGYVNAWREATMKKTNEYMSKLFPTEGQINYIDKYL